MMRKVKFPAFCFVFFLCLFDACGSFLSPSIETLPNGLRVVMFANGSRPNLDLSLVLKMDPNSDFQLISGLMAQALESSATKHSLRLAQLGATHSILDQENSIMIHIHGFGQDSETLLNILSEMTLKPTFPEKEFDLQKERWMENVRFHLSQPDTWLVRGYQVALGNQGESFQSEKQLNLYTREKVTGSYERHLSPASGTLILMGKMDQKQVLKQVATFFGGWKAPEADSLEKSFSVKNEKQKKLGTEILLIDAPTLYPVQVKLGFRLPKLNSDESKALILAHTILGGAYHSKLNRYSRDQLGLSYSLNSILHFNQKNGDLSVTSSSRKENVVPLIKSIFFVINQMREGSVTKEDLETAKEYISGSFSVMMSHPSVIVARWMEGDLFHLGDNYLEQFIPDLNLISLEQVRATIKKYFNPQESAVVVVGEGKYLKKDLSQLREVRVLSPKSLL